MNVIGLTLSGQYKVAVVDAITGKEIWRQPEWRKNLILNQGMDALGTYYPVEVMNYAIAGTGTRLNDISAGESSGSIINGVLYLLPIGSGIQNFNSTTYGGWIGGVLASGDTIRFADSTEARISAIIQSTSASINYTGSVSTQSFTIWKTSQTALQTEIKRGGNGISDSYYFSPNGECITYSSSYNYIHHQRTYDFSVETSTRNYSELGVAWDTDDSPSPSAFSRMVLPAVVTVNSAQRLRVIYQLNILYSPESASVMLNPPVSGWPVSPATNTNLTQSIQKTTWISRITSATGISDTTFGSLDPVSDGLNCAMFASTNSASIVQLGNAVPDRTTVADYYPMTKSAYNNNEYSLTKYGTVTQHTMNYTTLRSFGFGPYSTLFSYRPYNTTGQAFTILFEQSQSKFNTQTLTMVFKWIWRRILTS